jgi:hypothetical protein
MTETLKRDGKVTATSVPSDLALKISKAGALAPAGMARVDLSKRRQRNRNLLSGHADTGIADADAHAPVGKRNRTCLHRAARRGELHRVADQVAEYPPELTRVTAHRRNGRFKAAFNRHAEVDRILPERGQRRLQNLLKRNLARVERILSALYLGNIENIVDDGQEMRGRVVDQIGVLDDLPGGEKALLVFADEPGETDYRIQGGAELVAHIGNEFGLHLARQVGFDACRVFGLASPLTQHGVGDQGSVLAHQRTARSRGC